MGSRQTTKARVFPLPFFMVLLAFCLPASVYPGPDAGGADVPAFPVIGRLEPGDTVFRQYQADVENARRLLFSRRRPGSSGGGPESAKPADTPPAVSAADPLAEALTLYEYTVKGQDLLALAARCNIPYAAIATLNRLPHIRELPDNAVLYLPSMPGLFIPEKPENDLELLMSSSRSAEDGFIITVRRGGAGERFLFIPGADFRPTERSFFLTGGFRFPLNNFRLSSGFGPRINPVTGNLRLHQGLDLAAPLGADVYAARDGVITEIGEDPVYGKYVIIEHSENWTSLYGHLSSVNTDLRKNVKSGSLIGKVGSTGQSTGPHLHFEIRQHGKAQNPDKLLFRRN
ncbi:MAG: M23 family metallopeptidase [Treponema sp.]|jgi:murein DD-endopeptidase MepM/ murein hydrolase activator NlpD|nr:M23 family metallopeptidase [Treponema sp.]